ncbi:four-carbon acid sugar kinase family protein [Aquimarina sp. RZ0]|uniref:four-carbon acid sugar kinase family protein n=1 Tax=Aquimarina sp. RZ0 TaxID=2607730 RepID=UPI0011F33CFB|nr:four-carbon acid sugar kinase family protein [Aquimarina sp. RZ0]KAA1245125.1 hypothetical protein F0000_13465 [Aquimarina sp. RZ0]
MNSISDISKTLPAVDITNYRDKNDILFRSLHKTCIVIDDDPTGNQTVYGIPLLTVWDVETLTDELKKKTPIFFILTNSRSLRVTEISEIYHKIAKNIIKASAITQRGYTIISRSDSTLRGHFSAEINAIKHSEDFLNTLTIFIPVMFEGGRITVNDIHYILDSGTLTPVNETAFSKDHSFGYTKANLKEWIEEKTNGNIQASEIASFSISEIRTLDIHSLSKQILALTYGTYCIINALNYNDLDKITQALLLAEKNGKKILYRTSSSFVPSYIGLSKKELLDPKDLFHNTTKNGGLLIIGSYVSKSSAQLKYLLSQADINNTIEIHIDQILGSNSISYLETIIAKADRHLKSGKNTIVYTSRKLVTGSDIDTTIAIATKVSMALVTLLKQISTRPKYILAKGGITSHDIAIKGLGMKRSKVLGQILPGIPVWEMGKETKFPKIPYIVFPGNVGTEESLYTLIQKLS